MYKINEFESDSVQYIIVLVPFIKGVQMAMVLFSFSLCYSESLLAITLQKYVIMLLLATETVSRTCIAVIVYLIASVSLPHFNYPGLCQQIVTITYHFIHICPSLMGGF
jgi:hypothetical protein